MDLKAKDCRVLQFKLRKTERRADSVSKGFGHFSRDKTCSELAFLENSENRKELDLTAKNCRVLQFKLRKAERRADSVSRILVM